MLFEAVWWMVMPETPRMLLCFRGALEGRSLVERWEGKSLSG